MDRSFTALTVHRKDLHFTAISQVAGIIFIDRMNFNTSLPLQRVEYSFHGTWSMTTTATTEHGGSECYNDQAIVGRVV